MKKILVLLIILVLFAGCSSLGLGEKTSAITIGSGSSKTSTSDVKKGVVLTFADGNPPKEMFKGEPYTFAFVFQNFLKHDIENVRIKSKGFDTNFVRGLVSETSVSRIPKASPEFGPGVFSGLVVSGVTVNDFQGDYSFSPSFDYCYQTKTVYREQICVKSTKNQCDIDVPKSSDLDGIVSVTVGDVQVVGNDILVRIELSNAGSGEIVNECFKTEDFERKYDSFVVKLGSTVGNCVSSSERNTFISGKSSQVCRFARTQEDAYSSQISVEFNYLYQQNAKTSVKVKDLSQFTN